MSNDKFKMSNDNFDNNSINTVPYTITENNKIDQTANESTYSNKPVNHLLSSLMARRGPRQKTNGAFGGKRKHNHITGWKKKQN